MDCDVFLGWNGNIIRCLMNKYKACRLCLFNINDDDDDDDDDDGYSSC